MTKSELVILFKIILHSIGLLFFGYILFSALAFVYLGIQMNADRCIVAGIFSALFHTLALFPVRGQHATR